jgi:hypothetical protein
VAVEVKGVGLARPEGRNSGRDFLKRSHRAKTSPGTAALASASDMGNDPQVNPALVVVPTYNERHNLSPLAERILALEPKFDILVVDDSSPDGTGDVADALARGSDAVNVLHRPGKDGLGRAYVAGFKWALGRGYEYVCQMDADHSHDPAELPNLLAAASADLDLALGSRYLGGVRVLTCALCPRQRGGTSVSPRSCVSRGGRSRRSRSRPMDGLLAARVISSKGAPPSVRARLSRLCGSGRLPRFARQPLEEDIRGAQGFAGRARQPGREIDIRKRPNDDRRTHR